MTKEERELWEQALAIIDDNLEIVEGDIIGNRFATATKIVEFAQEQVKNLKVSKSFYCETKRGCLDQCDDCALIEINSIED